MRKSYWIGLVLLLLIGWWQIRRQQAIAALPDRNVLIAMSLQSKVDKYTKMVRDRCMDKVMAEAKEIADSIAFIKADSLMILDTLTRPPKPIKPEKPLKKPLRDSQAVKPLFDSLSVQ